MVLWEQVSVLQLHLPTSVYCCVQHVLYTTGTYRLSQVPWTLPLRPHTSEAVCTYCILCFHGIITYMSRGYHLSAISRWRLFVIYAAGEFGSEQPENACLHTAKQEPDAAGTCFWQPGVGHAMYVLGHSRSVPHQIQYDYTVIKPRSCLRCYQKHMCFGMISMSCS